MALFRTVRDLALKAVRAPSPAPPPRSVSITCRVVDDYQVAAEYPGHVLRPYGCFRYNVGPPAEPRMLTAFPIDGAIVTTRYIVVDPKRGYLFTNQTYETLPLTPEFVPGATGQDHHFSSGELVDVAGTVVVIGGPFEFNYYHGLVNWFSRFAIVQQLAPHLLHDPSVRFLVDKQGRREPFRAMLAAIGIPEERIVWADHERDYRIERAWLVSFIHEGLICPDILRAHADRMMATLGIERRARGRRRFWISREHLPDARRRIANHAEIAPALAAHGFETVVLEDMAFADQVRLFADAEIVTGSHGAGYTNVIFCPPAARLLVIEKDFARMLGIARLFSSLGETSGVSTTIVPATSIRPDDVDWSIFVNCHFADAHVDPADYIAALDDCVRAAEAPPSSRSNIA